MTIWHTQDSTLTGFPGVPFFWWVDSRMLLPVTLCMGWERGRGICKENGLWGQQQRPGTQPLGASEPPGRAQHAV